MVICVLISANYHPRVRMGHITLH